MALGDPYVTLNDVKTYLSIDLTKTSMDSRLTDAINSASREVERYCDRQFNDAGTVSTRVFEPSDWLRAEVDDFSTTAGLIVKTDAGGVGTFDTLWDATQYELSPYNGIVDGEVGWPYSTIRATRGLYFPIFPNEPYRRRAILQVTAQWGWAAVPSPVRQATLMLAAQTFKLADAPFGVTGFADFGVIRVRDLPQVQARLSKYMRHPILAG